MLKTVTLTINLFRQRLINRWNNLSQDDIDAATQQLQESSGEEKKMLDGLFERLNVYKSLGCTRAGLKNPFLCPDGRVATGGRLAQ